MKNLSTGTHDWNGEVIIQVQREIHYVQYVVDLLYFAKISDANFFFSKRCVAFGFTSLHAPSC